MIALLTNRYVRIGLAALAALALLFGLYRCGRSDGIETERARAEAVDRVRFDAAQNRSTAERDIQTNAAAANQSAMQRTIDNAVTFDPQGARQPVGPAVSGSLDELRRRNTPAKPR